MREALSESNLRNLRQILVHVEKTAGEGAPLATEMRELVKTMTNLSQRFDHLAAVAGDELATVTLPQANTLMRELSTSSRLCRGFSTVSKAIRRCCSSGAERRCRVPARLVFSTDKQGSATMKRRLAIIAGLILAACGGGAVTKEVLRYDFGSVAAGGGGAGSPRVSLAMVDVQAASWLSGPDMHFRLAYAEPLQRRSYSESRWAAPPAELLEAFLKRRIVFRPGRDCWRGLPPAGHARRTGTALR
jgi:hypothetical protein